MHARSRAGKPADLGFGVGEGAVSDRSDAAPGEMTGGRYDESPVGALKNATGLDQPGGAGLPPGYQRIVTTIFTIDEERVFDELARKLKFDRPASRLEYGDLADALEEASQLAWKASQLSVNAKAALESYLAEVTVLRSDMRDKARGELEGAKEGKAKGESKGKAITDADIVSHMAGMFPDQFRDIEQRITRAEGAVKHLSNLADRWVERVKVLDALIRTSRKTG